MKDYSSLGITRQWLSDAVDSQCTDLISQQPLAKGQVPGEPELEVKDKIRKGLLAGVEDLTINGSEYHFPDVGRPT